MLIEFFVIGSFAFWALLGAVAVFCFFCIEKDELPALTIFTIVITILILVFAGDLGNYVINNPWLLAVIPAWVAIVPPCVAKSCILL